MCRRTILPALVALTVCAAFPALARADIDTGLVVYWPLDGDAADATGDGNAGRIKGDIVLTADRFGYHDCAMHFPGATNARIYLNGRWPGRLLSRGAMTLAAWVRADTLDRAGRVIFLEDAEYERRSCSLELAPAGIVRFEIAYPEVGYRKPGTGIVVTRADSQPLTFGPAQWFHVAGVFRPGEALELWINGQQAARQPVTLLSHFVDSWGSMQVGGPDQPWQGDIDEVRLYARALSPQDMSELYTFAPTPHLKAWDPEPADGAVGVLFSQLRWKHGATAACDDLYFGMTPELGPADFVGRFTFPPWIEWLFLSPGTSCFWRVDQVEADGTTIHTGDTWHFTTRPNTAFDPWPADGAEAVSPEMDLRWSPGIDATSYAVYFGTDVNALARIRDGIYASAPACTRHDPGLLEAGKMYSWRLDEVGKPDASGSAHTRVGPVWSFTTADLPVVDDFESYGPDDSYCNHVHDTWLGTVPDEIWDPGPELYPPYLERTIVQSGRQAMVFDYNNVVEPYYSEIFREFTTAQNWTVNGADTLVLHVRGLATNDPAPLCVAVEDMAGKQAVAVHPDPQVLLSTKWVEWQIPLRNMIPVSPAKVKRVYLGVGDRRNPTPGGLGWVYVDDIRVIKGAS